VERQCLFRHRVKDRPSSYAYLTNRNLGVRPLAVALLVLKSDEYESAGGPAHSKVFFFTPAELFLDEGVFRLTCEAPAVRSGSSEQVHAELIVRSLLFVITRCSRS